MLENFGYWESGAWTSMVWQTLRILAMYVACLPPNVKKGS